MFIDRDNANSIRRSEERNVSGWVPVYLNSAPPNGAGGISCLCYKHATQRGGASATISYS